MISASIMSRVISCDAPSTSPVTHPKLLLAVYAMVAPMSMDMIGEVRRKIFIWRGMLSLRRWVYRKIAVRRNARVISVEVNSFFFCIPSTNSLPMPDWWGFPKVAHASSEFLHRISTVKTNRKGGI